MKKKWTLHILCQKGSAHSIAAIYAVAIDRETAARGGGIHTVPYPSWQHLSAALTAVGIEDSGLPDLKAKLDREGRGHIPEVFLDEADVRSLGFTRKQIPASAFA